MEPFGLIALLHLHWSFIFAFDVGFVMVVFLIGLVRLVHCLAICWMIGSRGLMGHLSVVDWTVIRG